MAHDVFRRLVYNANSSSCKRTVDVFRRRRDKRTTVLQMKPGKPTNNTIHIHIRKYDSIFVRNRNDNCDVDIEKYYFETL